MIQFNMPGKFGFPLKENVFARRKISDLTAA